MSITTNIKHFVYLNGWELDEEGEPTHCEGDAPDGWCVYVVKRNARDETIDDPSLPHEDFMKLAAARTFAEEMRLKYGCDQIREY